MKNPMIPKYTAPVRGFAILIPFFLITSPAVQGEWFVEVGPFYRGHTEISVDGGSRAHDSGIHAPSTVTRGATAAAPGTALRDDGNAAGTRSFDNGYVGPSGWVWAQNAGITQYFAYQTADQYNAGADTLRFTKTLTGTSATSTRTTTRITDRGSPGRNVSLIPTGKPLAFGMTRRMSTSGNGAVEFN